MGVRGVALAIGLALAGPALAQEAQVTVAPPVLILDSERLWAESEYGKSLRDALDARTLALKTENDRIVADLTAEEQDLTERRPDMDPDAFRAEAEAFDAKVQDIRAARDAKEAELERDSAAARVQFFDEVRPLVGRLMVERGALTVIDSRSIVVGVRAADITDAAIAWIDENPPTSDAPE